MARPKVDIVICAYNNELIIRNCLKRIKGSDYKFNKCIVVDDHSTDSTVKIIKDEFPWAVIIEKSVQTGPSESKNLGINQSEAEYVLFLDSDILLTRRFISNLVRSITKMENVAICGGKLLLPDNSIDSAGGGLTKIGIGFDFGHKKESKNYNQGKDVMYIPSAAMLASRRLIKELGGFDDTYFYGHEDTDLCWRVNLSGFRVYYTPNTIAYHYKNQTVKKMLNSVYYYGTRNRIRSLIKNHQGRTLLKYLPLYFIFSLVDILIRPYRKEKIKAWWWNLRNIGDTFKKRKQVQSLRVFNDNELPFSSMYNLFK